jgi:hypothetical protein
LRNRVVLALFKNNRTGIAQLIRPTDADAHTDANAGGFTKSQSLSHPYTRAGTGARANCDRDSGIRGESAVLKKKEE